MSFGLYSDETDRLGRHMIIPFRGIPALHLFVPRDEEDQGGVSVFWRSWTDPNQIASWVRTAFDLDAEIQRFAVDWWYSRPSEVVEMGRDDVPTFTEISSDLLQTGEDITVTISSKHRFADFPKYYLWFDLRQSSPPVMSNAFPVMDAKTEIGFRVPSVAFEAVSSRALLGHFLYLFMPVQLSDSDSEGVIRHLRANIAMARADFCPKRRSVAA